ncbi:MAG: bifunctional lysylphosphatidylglycerol flippase/synthetase MprF [Porticoccaceae bacterium]
MSARTPLLQNDDALPFANAQQAARWRWLRALRTLWPTVALALVGWQGWRELSGLDLHTLHHITRNLNDIDLIGLELLALLAVLVMCGYDLLLSRWLEVGLPHREVLRYAWPACTLANLLGLSGMAGSGVRYLALSREGVSGRTIAVYAGVQLLAVPVGLGGLCAVALAIAVQQATTLPLPHGVPQLVLATFAVYVPAFFLVTGSGALHRRFFHELPPLTAGLRLELIAISFAEWALALVVLGAALALAGVRPDPEELLVAFALAATAGIASQVPGGLGVLDGTLLVILSRLGYAQEGVLAGVLLFRLSYYLVPALLGLAIGARLFVPDESLFVRILRRAEAHPLFGVLRLPVELIGALGVRLLGYLTFMAGVVLLVSAAYPTLTERSALLHDYLPHRVVEGSHLLSVVAGVVLLSLSRGIAGEVRRAYQLTLLVLLAGALLSLVKGLDYEEAIYLLAVAALLVTRRKSFDRHAYPLLSRRNLMWLVALLAALGGYAWLGAALYGDEAWAASLLQVAPGAHAPRFARSLLVVMVTAIGMLGWLAFSMPKPRLLRPDDAALEQARIFYATQGGHEFAHLTLLGDKYLFYTPERDALIAYGAIRNRLVALGDPAGAPSAVEGAVLAFRQFADRYGCVPVFYEVSETNLHLYHDHGFGLFKLGEQALVPLADFSLRGKKRDDLRTAVNRAAREGLEFSMLEHPLPEVTWAELQGISEQWLGKKTAEKGFSLGRFERPYLSQAPIAVVRRAGAIVAFASLMPDYRQHQELSIDLMRHGTAAPPGCMDFLFVRLMEYARDAGYGWFNLGIAPLAGVGENEYARPAERFARLAYEYGNRFYNYKGLRRYKEKFQPEWRGAYLAYPYQMSPRLLLLDISALIAGGYSRVFTPN